MRSYWSEPFLWIHLAGIAAIPIFLELCCLGLAVGEPILPVWVELSLVAVLGVLPVLWMQLTRPFYIFSVLLLSTKPECLTHQQRQTLSLFKTKKNFLLAGIAAIVGVLVIWPVYFITPVATSLISFLPQWRLLGLLIAVLANAASNLFWQIPISVLGVMLTSESAFTTTQALTAEQVATDFTIPGWQVENLLPLGSTTDKHSN